MADEETVLRFILNRNSAKSELHSLSHVFDNDQPFYILNKLKAFRRIKALVKTSDINQSIVFVCIKGLRLCANVIYCKKGPTCPFLHLCPEFVSGTCSRLNCRFSHDVGDEHNRPVVEKSGITKMCVKDGVQLELVRCCTPIVCLDHNGIDGPGCSDPELCLKLHVCDEYFCDRCPLSDSDCLFGHDLYSERNMALLSLFELNHLKNKDERLLRKMILKAGSSFMNGRGRRNNGTQSMAKHKERNKMGNCHTEGKKAGSGPPWKVVNPRVDVSEQRRNFETIEEKDFEISSPSRSVCSGTAEFDRKQDELPGSFATSVATGNSPAFDRQNRGWNTHNFSGICKEFESHDCFGNLVCTNRHVPEPYNWRVQLCNTWTPFEKQIEIENAYCDPDYSQFNTTFMSNPITINFESMTCLYGAVQRLSTPSFVNCRDKSDATRWLWYWREGNSNSNLWIRYMDDKPPYQDVLESKYLNDKTSACWFETGDSEQYMIDFIEMEQTNLRTGFKRDVRRRPAGASGDKIIRGYRFQFDESKLPINEQWIPMNTELDSSTDLVPISADKGARKHLYRKVENAFFKTMSKANFEIERVYYIQNLHLWKNYQEKKIRMVNSNGQSGPTELILFHGTDDEKTVKCICHQNFDPRMHGVHGTVYGKGAYFATTAKYSHGYTKPFGSHGNRKMFFARVLVGKSTLGVTAYQRPPPLDSSRPHGALFDTCVNDVSNPSIYVVFANEQCYPEFLIEYTELSPAVSPPPRPSRITSTSQASGVSSSPHPSQSASPSSAYPTPRATTLNVSPGNSFVNVPSAPSPTATSSSGFQGQPYHQPTGLARSAPSSYTPSNAASYGSTQATKKDKGCCMM